MRIRKKYAVCVILAALFVLLGVPLRFVYTPMRFTGFLLLCAAGAVGLYVLLDLWSRRRRAGVICKRIFLGLIAAGFLLFATMEAWVLSWARTDGDTPVSAVVVLGAGVNGTTPSLSLQVRLEAALDYIAQRPGIPIVVTGSQGPGEDISEAACMAGWLADRGVDPARILLEDQADNTEENIRYSQEVLYDAGVDTTGSIAVVTSDYHLCRAAYLWGVPWMVPVAAHMPDSFWTLTVNYYIREAFAMAAELTKDFAAVVKHAF